MKCITGLSMMFLIVAYCTQIAAATVGYSDGGIHVISSPSPDISLSHSTTLNIATGAIINGPNGVSNGDAVSALDSTANHINITGGSITGANVTVFTDYGGNGVNMTGDFLNISGGTITGGAAPFIPAYGVLVTNTQVTISGGTFHGGDNTGSGYPSDAVGINSGTVLITGGTFSGGNGQRAGIGLSTGHIPNVTPPHVVITGGTFSPGTSQQGELWGGWAIADGYNYPGGVMDVVGGIYNGAILIEPNSVLNVHGSNLTLTPISDFTNAQSGIFGWHLAGTLSDGNTMSQNVLAYAPYTINLVPEPTSWIMASLGCVAAIALCRRFLKPHAT